MTRILLVDDDAETREILRDYLALDPTLDIVGEAANGQIAVAQAATLRPDVILMDMQMPVMDGVLATEQIHLAFPAMAILGLSTFSTDRYVIDLLRAGASGYLTKDALPKDLIAAVHAVAAGESALSPDVTRHVVRGVKASVSATVAPDATLASVLTEKEREVIALLADGLSNREMAQRLFVTESTIKARFVKITEKLGVRDRVQILVMAIARGIITIDDDLPFSTRM